MVKLYYPELLIKYEDITLEVMGQLVRFEPGDGDGDLGDFCLPIFLSREDCEKQYPGEKIGVIMFGIYEN